MPNRESVGTLYANVTADITGLRVGLKKAQTEMKVFSRRMKHQLRQNAAQYKKMSRQLAMGGAMVVAGLGATVKQFGDFDKAMRSATAVSEVTEAQFQQMAEMAEDQSVKLNKSLEGLAEGFYFLGSAGLEASEQLEAFDDVALLAKAGLIDMAQATEMTVDTMKGFKISFEDTGQVVDTFAKAVTSSNMKFGQLGQTLSLVSGVARTTNNSLSDTVAIIGKMANVGIKGTKAGTSLRRSMLSLASPASEARKQLEKLEISVYDNNGNMNSLIDIIAQLEKRFKTLSQEEKNYTLKTLFGARAVAGMIEVIDQGADELRRFSGELDNAGGTAQTVADKQMAGFNEQIGVILKKTRLLINAIGEKLAPIVKSLAEGFGSLVDKVRALPDGMMEFIAIGTGAAGVAAIFTAGVIALGVAASATSMSLIALSAAMFGLPILIGAIVGGIYALNKETNELEKQLNNVREEQNKTMLEFENARSIYNDLKDVTEKTTAQQNLYNEAIETLQRLAPDTLNVLDDTKAGADEIATAFENAKQKLIEYNEQQVLEHTVKGLREEVGKLGKEYADLWAEVYTKAQKQGNEEEKNLLTRLSKLKSIKKVEERLQEIYIEEARHFDTMIPPILLQEEEILEAKQRQLQAEQTYLEFIKEHKDILEEIKSGEEEVGDEIDKNKNKVKKIITYLDKVKGGYTFEAFDSFINSIKENVEEGKATLTDFSEFYYQHLETEEERRERQLNRRLETLKEFYDAGFISEANYIKMKERLWDNYNKYRKTEQEEYLDFYRENIATEGEVYESGIREKIRQAEEWKEKEMLSDEELIQYKKQLWRSYSEWWIENNELMGGSIEALFDSIEGGFTYIVDDWINGVNMMKQNWGEYMKEMANSFARALNRMFMEYLAKKAMFAIIGLFTGGPAGAATNLVPATNVIPAFPQTFPFESGGLVGMNGMPVADRGGLIGGLPHSQGGTLIEAERGEMIINEEATAKYYPILKSINDDLELKNFDVGGLVGTTDYSFSPQTSETDNSKIVGKLEDIVTAINDKPVARTQEIRMRDLAVELEFENMKRNKT